jgi:hypothetical protein
MKSRSLALGLVVLLTMVIVPVSASSEAPTSFKANGRDLWYPGFDPNYPGSSMIVGGNYNMAVRNYDADTHTGDSSFQLFYKEMNLVPGDEGGAPIGSVDHFQITLIETYGVDMNPDWYLGDQSDPKCIIYGKFRVDKLAWMPEGSTPRKSHFYYFFGDVYGYAWVCQGNLEFEAWPWHIWGAPPTSINMR